MKDLSRLLLHSLSKISTFIYYGISLTGKIQLVDHLWTLHCYKSPKKKITFYAFKQLIYNLKAYDGIKL